MSGEAKVDPERVLAVAKGMQSRGGWANDQWESLSSEARGRWMSRAEYAVLSIDEYDERTAHR